MIDIHCHILPGIDDGPSDIDTSAGMLKIAANDGITHIVATPHYVYNGKLGQKAINEGIKQLAEKASEEGIKIKLSGGADIRLTYELVQGLKNRDFPSLNNSRYFLLELPEIIPPGLENFLLGAHQHGFVPIITHPERNYSLLSAPEKIGPLEKSCALFQVTAMSITGDFGPQIKMFSHMLVRKGLVDFVASDAHDIHRRIPVLSRAYREFCRLAGEKEARRVFSLNPECVIENREINQHPG